MPLARGDKLGPYEIHALVGMGEVYRKHDTNLSRDVAIKNLPALQARRKYMKQLRWTILPLIAALVILADLPVNAEVLDKSKNIGGTTVHYKIVLPKNFDASKAYPGVLGFGGGSQTMNVVDNVIARNFRGEAEKCGYIVVVRCYVCFHVPSLAKHTAVLQLH